MACIHPESTEEQPPKYARGRCHALVPSDCSFDAEFPFLQSGGIIRAGLPIIQEPFSVPSSPSLRNIRSYSTPRSEPSPNPPVSSIEGRGTRGISVSSSDSARISPLSHHHIATPKLTGLWKRAEQSGSRHQPSAPKTQAHYRRDEVVGQPLSNQQTFNDYITAFETTAVQSSGHNSSVVGESVSATSSVFPDAGSLDDDHETLTVYLVTTPPKARPLRKVLSEEMELRVLAREDTPHSSQVYSDEELDNPDSPEHFAFSIAGSMEVSEKDGEARLSCIPFGHKDMLIDPSSFMLSSQRVFVFD